MTDIDPVREQRVTERGEAFTLQALHLAAHAWPDGDLNVIVEGCEYLVEAIIQFAIHHIGDPQPILDLVINALRSINAKQRRDRAIARIPAFKGKSAQIKESQPPIHINPDREQRVTEHGRSFALQALDLATSAWAHEPDPAQTEALEYLIEGIIQLAIHHKDPQPVLDLVIDDLRDVDAKQRRNVAIATALRKSGSTN